MSAKQASTIRVGLAIARLSQSLNDLKRFIQAQNIDLFVFPEGHLQADQLPRAKEFISKTKRWVITGIDDTSQSSCPVEQAILINPDGEIVALHTKTSLTQSELDRGYVPGRTIEPLDTPWGKIGVAICFEIHFPEVTRTLALKGARLIVNPIGTGMWHERQYKQWNAIASARASENEVPVVGVSHYNDTIPMAYAYDEWGDRLVCCRDQNRLVVVDIKLPDVTKKRKFAQRRPELYSIISQSEN